VNKKKNLLELFEYIITKNVINTSLISNVLLNLRDKEIKKEELKKLNLLLNKNKININVK